MDLVQSKLNVIEWVTDYRGHFYDTERVKIVELTHKHGLKCTMFSAKTVALLLHKLDCFIESKLNLSTKTVGKSVTKTL